MYSPSSVKNLIFPPPPEYTFPSTIPLYFTFFPQEAFYIEQWPNMTSAWPSWKGYDISVNRCGGVHSLLLCTSCTLGHGVSYLPVGYLAGKILAEKNSKSLQGQHPSIHIVYTAS